MRVLYCAGEQARVTLDILSRIDDDESIALLDDDPDTHGESVNGYEVLGGDEQFAALNPGEDRMLVALGRIDSDRAPIAQKVREAGFALFSAIDPETTISETATIGDGVTINARTYVGPDVTIDDLALVDSAVNISHDVHVGEGATVAPNVTLTGGVEVAENAYIGAGATVLDHRKIGANATVGAGAVVTEDVSRGARVAGVPAVPIER